VARLQSRATISDSAGRWRSSAGLDGVPIWMKPAAFHPLSVPAIEFVAILLTIQ
jgi:hypothetical protein